MEKDGALITEPSLINNYITYRDVQVTKLSNQMLVTLFAEKRKDIPVSDWYLGLNSQIYL